MAYIGKAPGFAIRGRYIYTASASQTSFSGVDDNGETLAYQDGKYTDVYLNGVLLVGGGTDYTANTGTSIVLASGATASDLVEIIAYDIFSLGDLSDYTNTLKLGFTQADGTAVTIPLATGQKIPFTKADGSSSNFNLTN